MDLQILCIGDVVGRPGRTVLADALPKLVQEHDVHCTIVNAENATNGAGLSADMYQKIVAAGANLITLGDHIYKKKEIIPVLEREQNIVKPANYPPAAPGRDVAIYKTPAGPSVAVISLMGRLFMKVHASCPYTAADRVLASLPQDVKIIVVDFHAEATSEKVAMGWHLDGRASVVYGTHTHIPTADETILPRKTAYITDLGMTGPYDSVIGRDKNRVLSAFTTNVPAPFDVATDDVRLCGILATVSAETGRATAIQRIRYDAKNA